MWGPVGLQWGGRPECGVTEVSGEVTRLGGVWDGIHAIPVSSLSGLSFGLLFAEAALGVCFCGLEGESLSGVED